ncbi:transport protein particle component [Choiromyces venosus 120613-1]|uniref:Transport protein particle component n=1 Tax=Choiromyces venosus 120613-1 TaxID=1336337 RepID=A0A3N4K5F2_9PEZI|nr:transport protein particle component [Choiromyces venosus 120613-1]
MSFEPPLPPFNASDPHATFLNSTCLDLLLIEIVPLAHRLSQQFSTSSSISALHPSSSSSPSSAAAASGGGGGDEEEEEREAVFYRLEMLGYRVGHGLVERFSRDRPRMSDTLDVIKFVCKDLWTIVFRKQIDNLKTNHRGVYVLTDNSFKPFSRMSAETGGNAVARAQPFLWFPCGIVRGALANMGVNASVQAETTELPSATFKIETLSKPVA